MNNNLNPSPFPLGTTEAGVPYLGRHMLAEFMGCNSNILNNPERIEQFMKEAAIECGATIVSSCFHQFNPFGVSGVVVIAESHLAIHTWPELGYAAIDIFTCGEACNPKVAYEYLKEKFASEHSIFTQVVRGLLNPQTNAFETEPYKLQFMQEDTTDTVQVIGAVGETAAGQFPSVAMAAAAQGGHV